MTSPPRTLWQPSFTRSGSSDAQGLPVAVTYFKTTSSRTKGELRVSHGAMADSKLVHLLAPSVPLAWACRVIGPPSPAPVPMSRTVIMEPNPAFFFFNAHGLDEAFHPIDLGTALPDLSVAFPSFDALCNGSSDTSCDGQLWGRPTLCLEDCYY